MARYVERKNGSKGYWIKDKILSLTVQKIKNNYTGDYTFHLFCKVGYNGKRVNLNIRRLVYKIFVDDKLDEQDKTYWVVSVKDGNGIASTKKWAMISRGKVKKLNEEELLGKLIIGQVLNT